MNQQLVKIAATQDRSEKQKLYSTLLSSLFQKSPLVVSDYTCFLAHLVQESLGLVLSRQLLNDFLKEMKGYMTRNRSSEESMTTGSDLKTVLEFALHETSARATAFEEQVRAFFCFFYYILYYSKSSHI